MAENNTDGKQVILVTGSRTGIGRHLAEHYAAGGHQVIGCSRTAPGGELDNYQHFCLDVADEEAVTAMFADIKKTYGRLDVLINNAGVSAMMPLMMTRMEDVESVFRTNVTAMFLLCREAARVMRRKKFGRIVNFTSVATPQRAENQTVYAASKAAVNSLTEVLSKELASFGITVNAIGPTLIKTEMIEQMPEDMVEAKVQQQVIKRMGNFDDIANVVDFFIKPESSFITAQTIYLGGI